MTRQEQVSVGADKALIMAVAPSRFSKQWKSQEFTWKELVGRLKSTTRTSETVKEYRSMTKANRDSVKDVGGFVGGALKGGRRTTENVANRSVLTLDLDDVTTSVEDLWDAITMVYGQELLIYSTHSHTKSKPRLRVIIPFLRSVYPDEYQAIARRVAGDIGMEYFDPTTFEPARLMYWPSTPKDGDYVFKYQAGGKFLNPDDVLATYMDWKDISEWPSSTRLDASIVDKTRRQEDPLEKRGVIGAFCRTYTIQAAIETYLSDVYTASRSGDRFTYRKGSTVDGLVVYDDKFAYSHHGTDPTSGQLCNAFDLVRIHLYGELDAEAKEDTPVNRLPSYLKMQDRALKDARVKEQLGLEKVQAVTEDFDFEDETEKDQETAWLSLLTYDKRGNLENSIENARLIMENDPRVKERLKYDSFSNRALVLGEVPWTDQKDHDWSDMDDSGLRHFMETNYGVTTAYKIDDAKNLIFESHKYHPVRDYLKGLKWDGVARIETMFTDYLGVEDNIYTREAAMIHLTAAVARVMRPGTKYDQMITLVGPQGVGKTSFIRKLGRDWYSSSQETLKGKEAAELLQGVWIVELEELNATRKADRDAVKGFLSKQEDIYRVAYARHTTRFPRQCIFWGTTNEYTFLRDPTGDRRTWPLVCMDVLPLYNVFEDLTEEIVDQLWAEAYENYVSGGSLLLSDEAKEIAIIKQGDHKEDVPIVGLIESYLNAKYPANWDEMSLGERRMFIDGSGDVFTEAEKTYVKDRVCVMEIWCELLGNSKGNLKPINSREINDALRGLPGWEQSRTPMRFGKLYGSQRGYQRME